MITRQTRCDHYYYWDPKKYAKFSKPVEPKIVTYDLIFFLVSWSPTVDNTFLIKDFDGDEHVGPADLQQALTLLTSNELNADETAQVCAKVIEESDVDGDGKLSFIEFEHVILRAPDFLSTFHIRI